MSFENVMGTLMRWNVAVEAAAALGAELSLMQSDGAAPREISEALRAVTAAAGLDGLDELSPQQRAVVVGIVRLYIRQAGDLLDDPAREPGWTFTDPVILDGWGRGSAMVPPAIASAVPELSEVRSFLDVGTGVGLLAVAAATVWPNAAIVGIDTWEPSLKRARDNVAGAGLQDRITLRSQDVAALDDVDTYDLAWVPTFFVTESALPAAVSRLLRAARPGGWVALGRFMAPPDPLAATTAMLRTIRGGGCDISAEHATSLLKNAGYTSVHAVPPKPGAMPLEFVMGQRPQ